MPWVRALLRRMSRTVGPWHWKRMTTKDRIEKQLEKLIDGLVTAADGSGPLLQRDYWGVIANARETAHEIAERVARDFCSFAPEDLVRFERGDASDEPLEVGDELEVAIRMAGRCRVRVVDRGPNSITLATVRGHPEAGRITFGAYPNRAGDVVFHIRSRARSSSGAKYAGFITAGEPMQTTTWTDYVDRLAHTVGDGVIGAIMAETREIADEAGDPETICSPTFIAVDESSGLGLDRV
jgi:hypothetical protein